MSIILKFKYGNSCYTLETTPIGTGDVLFFIINNIQPLTLCHNDPCNNELTLDYIEEKGTKCPTCRKLNNTKYTSIIFFRKLITNMLGNPSEFIIENIIEKKIHRLNGSVLTNPRRIV